MATKTSVGGERTEHEALRKLKEWAPVIGVLLAILALFVALAILFGAVLGRMETRLRVDLEQAETRLRTEAATDKAEVLGQIESVRTDVRALGADVRADLRDLREELAPVGDITAILELLKERQ
ncbi:MAG: hypothetical protein OXJ62_05500 [Spirochaetaceae bacterium]|nr:hypothetical protein [Spirochaetaceae bacterium]